MDNDPRDTVRSLAALADIPMTTDRIAAAALGLPLVQAAIQALSQLEYGEVEPAAQFRPPGRSQQ